MTEEARTNASLKAPRHQLGYVLPVVVADFIHYQFYRVVPEDCILVCSPFSARDFSPSAADEAMAMFSEQVQYLAGRGAGRICQAGIPMSANWGRRRTRALMQENADRHPGIVVEADFEDAVNALHALGVRKLAVAAKWDVALMDRVAGYASDAGFEPIVHYGDPYDAADVVRIAPQEGVDLALELGRSALRAAPGADGLLLAGGSWFSMAAIPVLEAEFGKPVVTNPTATYWATMLQFGLSPSRRGCGRLLDSMPPDGRVKAR